jgi:hypothetical protein
MSQTRSTEKGRLSAANRAEFKRLFDFALTPIADAVDALKREEPTRQKNVVVVFNPHDADSRMIYRMLAASPYAVPGLPREPEPGSVQVIGMLYEVFLEMATEVYGMRAGDEYEPLAPEEVAVIVFVNRAYVRCHVKTTDIPVPRGLIITRGGTA